MRPIRNVVFDVGNVLITWDPVGIVSQAFSIEREEAALHRERLFVEPDIWRALNRGEMTIGEAQAAYVADGHLGDEESARFFAAIHAGLELIEETVPLVERLSEAGYRLFALTDNVREFVEDLSVRYAWWSLLEGVTVSAEVGCLKPDPRIYRHLLDTHGLVAEETVFLDDMQRNVDGARALGMHALLFTNSAQAERDLRALGVEAVPAP